MNILDICCGGGGAALGLHLACPDAEIIGIDIEDFYGVYPFDFVQADILEIDRISSKFDFIWASPPCQAFSLTQSIHKKEYPNLIPYIRELCLKASKPFVIENVIHAPLRKDLMLCGTMFNKKFLRHRIFEMEGFKCEQPVHEKHKGRVANGDYFTIAGHDPNNKVTFSKYILRYIMEIPHIVDREILAEAVPPCYSKYIMEQFIGGLK